MWCKTHLGFRRTFERCISISLFLAENVSRPQTELIWWVWSPHMVLPFFWCSGPTESVLFLNVSSSDHDPAESEFYSSSTNPFHLINRKQDFNYGVIPFKASSPASPPCSELRMALIYSLCISYLLFIFWYSVCTYSSERCYGEEIRERWNVRFLFEPRLAGLVKHFALLWYLSLSFFLCWF